MQRYEYKVIPAPKKGQRAKGAKGSDGRFANALQTLMNVQAADGWQYLRADTLPCEERSGLTGRATVFQNVLVFSRDVAEPEMTAPIALIEQAHIEPVENEPTPAVDPVEEPEPAIKPTLEGVIRKSESNAPPSAPLGGVRKSSDDVVSPDADS